MVTRSSLLSWSAAGNPPLVGVCRLFSPYAHEHVDVALLVARSAPVFVAKASLQPGPGPARCGGILLHHLILALATALQVAADVGMKNSAVAVHVGVLEMILHAIPPVLVEAHIHHVVQVAQRVDRAARPGWWRGEVAARTGAKAAQERTTRSP